jgi:CheY-like chemotaxis protein
MKSVLVIDNNAKTRTTLQNLLTLKWPHISVITAETGPKGLHLAHEMQPDVILLECNLPGLDSYQTAKMLRHLPETQSIPLIALTQNQEQPNQQVIGLQGACHAWLTQPIAAEALVSAITSVQTVNRRTT